MNIAFDLDGCILEQNLGLLRIINTVAKGNETLNRELMRYYCAHLKIQLNPLDFISTDDTLFFITGRSKEVEDLTIDWTNKYFPQAKLFITKIADSIINQIEMHSWYDLQSTAKAKVINEQKIDIFFDDCPEIVTRLRKLCPNTKVVKYGSRQITESMVC